MQYLQQANVNAAVSAEGKRKRSGICRRKMSSMLYLQEENVNAAVSAGVKRQRRYVCKRKTLTLLYLKEENVNIVASIKQLIQNIIIGISVALVFVIRTKKC